MSKLYVVPTPIGNLGDITRRALEILGACDLILAEDTRHTQKLLNHFDIKAKMISYHKFNEKQRSEEIVQRLLNEEINEMCIRDRDDSYHLPGSFRCRCQRYKRA